MSLPTKLAITGLWGRGADAAGVPDACGRNGADRGGSRNPHAFRRPAQDSGTSRRARLAAALKRHGCFWFRGRATPIGVRPVRRSIGAAATTAR
jgi:hypothetical protein